MTSIASAWGKLILFGEHAAVRGYPATGLPLPGAYGLACSTGIPETDAGFHQVSDTDLMTINSLLQILDAAGSPIHGGDSAKWYTSGGISRAGGFGSSAALCVALARISLRINDGAYSREVHRLANRLEHMFHGSPSGIDTGMAGDRIPASWTPQSGDVPLRKALEVPEIHLAYGALPRSENTAETVASIGSRMDSKDSRTISAIAELGSISESFIALCRSAVNVPDSAKTFTADTGILADRAQVCLSDLGLSTPGLDRILDHGRKAGAAGGKLSGGGTGGAFWMVFDNRDSRDSWLAETASDDGLKRETGLIGPLSPLDTASMYPLVRG